MSKPITLVPNKATVNPNVVALLEEFLTMAKKGELHYLIAVGGTREDNIEAVGGHVYSLTGAVGQLELLKQKLIVEQYLERES